MNCMLNSITTFSYAANKKIIDIAFCAFFIGTNLEKLKKKKSYKNGQTAIDIEPDRIQIQSYFFDFSIVIKSQRSQK